ncbi:hypothetical protein Tco_1244728 [Tanacetum coccineum]
MDTTKAQQKALDDDLVAPANRLQIGKCNLLLSSTLNSKEPTLQVICPKLPGQKFKDPPFEEEILSFIRDIGHIGELKKTVIRSGRGQRCSFMIFEFWEDRDNVVFGSVIDGVTIERPISWRLMCKGLMNGFPLQANQHIKISDKTRVPSESNL